MISVCVTCRYMQRLAVCSGSFSEGVLRRFFFRLLKSSLFQHDNNPDSEGFLSPYQFYFKISFSIIEPSGEHSVFRFLEVSRRDDLDFYWQAGSKYHTNAEPGVAAQRNNYLYFRKAPLFLTEMKFFSQGLRRLSWF